MNKIFIKKSFVLLTTALFLIGGFFVSVSVAQASYGEIVISEFVSDPSSGSEWVELLNTTDSDITVSNFTLKELTNPSTTPVESDFVAPLSGTIPAHGILVLEGTNLNNAGDSIGLYDNNSLLWYRVTYGTVIGDYFNRSVIEAAPGTGQSAFRDSTNSWHVVDFNTKNSANIEINNGATYYETIQNAIDVAISGDTINVGAGTYTESLTVNETLSIAGVGDTTIITPAQDSDGVVVMADSVLIQDLKINTSNSGVMPNKAVSVEEADNLEINNVTVETTGNKAMGIWVGGSNNGLAPVSGLTIVKSTITVNNEATGIYADHSSSAHSGWMIGGSAENTNTIIAEFGNPIELYDVMTSEVSHNTITTSASGGSAVIWSSELSNLSNLIFNDNAISYSGGSQVAFLTDFILNDGNTTVSNVTVSSNTFDNWGSRGLRIGGGVTSVVASENKFLGTGEVLKNEDVTEVTATNNWWGTAISTEIASKVVGLVDFDPYYIDDTMTTTNVDFATAKAVSHDALTVVLGSYTETDYTTENWATLTGFKSDGDTAIDAATTLADVTLAEDTATVGMAGVETIAETLAAAKIVSHDALIDALAEYSSGDYTAENWTTLNGFKTDGDTAIDAATTLADVTLAEDAATVGMAGVATDLADAKVVSHDVLEVALASYTQGNYTEANWTILNGFKSDGDTAIDAATTLADVTLAEDAATVGMAGVVPLSNNQTTPDSGTGEATVSPTTPEVIVTDPDQAVIITVDSGTDNPVINFDALITSGTGTLPETTVNSTVGSVVVEVVIPDDTVVTADSSWDGTMLLPQIDSGSTGNAPSGFSVGDTVIEVGSSLFTLSFDKAVKITLTGVTGTVGYKPAGSDNWQTITTQCNSATDSSNISSGECYFTSGSDTVIWTYHFTSFGGLNVAQGNSSGSRPAGPVLPAQASPVAVAAVLGASTGPIPGCGNRTTGFSVATGESCVGNSAGQVLGAEKFNFTRFLKESLNGGEVMELQKFLNNNNYLVASVGAGSPGNETNYFRLKTKLALIKFQIANGLKGDGVVGALTRAILNK